MRARIVAALAGLGLAVSLAGSGQAQIRLDRPAGGGGGGQAAPSQPGGTMATITADQVIQILQGVGYGKAQKTNTSGKDKFMRFDYKGTPVTVTLSGCEGENCTVLTYLIFFPKQDVTVDFINAYNRDKSFGKLYLEKNGELTVSMELFVFGGVTPAWIASTGSIFGGNVLKGLLEFKPE